MFKERTGFLDYFKKPVDPKELVRKWQSELRMEVRKTERQIREIEREKKNTEKSIRDAAKRNDMASAKILAREIVNTNKAITRLYVNKAQMISIQGALSEQLAMVRVSGTLAKSTEVMKMVNNLIKAPELAQIMHQMSAEMMRMGLIEEMMEDALEDSVGEDLEEETDAEVEKVLSELAVETTSQLASAPRHKAPAQAVAAEEDEEEEDNELGDLQSRLAAIRN